MEGRELGKAAGDRDLEGEDGAGFMQDQLHDEFKGDTLRALEAYGVQAFLESDVQNDLLAKVKDQMSREASAASAEEAGEKATAEAGKAPSSAAAKEAQDGGALFMGVICEDEKKAAPVVTKRRRRIPRLKNPPPIATRRKLVAKKEKEELPPPPPLPPRGDANPRVNEVVRAMRASIRVEKSAKARAKHQLGRRAGRKRRQEGEVSGGRRRLPPKRVQRRKSAGSTAASPAPASCPVCTYSQPAGSRICVMCGSSLNGGEPAALEREEAAEAGLAEGQKAAARTTGVKRETGGGGEAQTKVRISRTSRASGASRERTSGTGGEDEYDDDSDDPAWVPGGGEEAAEDEEEFVDRDEAFDPAELQDRQEGKQKKRNRRGKNERAGMAKGNKRVEATPAGRQKASRRLPTIHDDADDDAFRERILLLAEKAVREEAQGIMAEDAEIQGGLVVPGQTWDKLLSFQQTGVGWLWELYLQNSGGIVADEMGLGKTVQTIAFFAALHHTAANEGTDTNGVRARKHARQGASRPSLIVCPASMLVPWLREFRVWHPERRVMLLHDSGNHEATKTEILRKAVTSNNGNAPVIVTTYETMRILSNQLERIRWGLVVLDEGHKIRNPEAAVTEAAKKLKARMRVVLSGQPIQNSLVELWSLFDFIIPGKLGTQQVFEEQFVIPIQMGGYKNASNMFVQVAHRSTIALRGLITPYILRRTKAKVAKHLPQKTEHVLFCNLAADQREAYREFVMGCECHKALSDRSLLFKSMHVLIKLCNHPDLLLLQPTDPKKPHSKKVIPEGMEDYGEPERSGKMRVLREILTTWKLQGHKYLIFSQRTQMLDIIERMINKQLNLAYSRIDGSTSIKSRQPLIDRFNTDPSVDCMLLTTQAAGVGISLTAANRVVIFDPHWNPSNDNQAKERSYRIGQKRDVKVFRLITKDTIEEKIYHRQIHKEFLTSKVLSNPDQKRFFTRGDLTDLFVCPPPLEESLKKKHTETAQIFAETKSEVTPGLPKTERGQGADENNIVEDEEDLLSFVIGGEGWAHSALSHDKILSANSAEAQEKVKLAMRKLARSGRRARNGREAPSSSSPMGSDALRARILERQQSERKAMSQKARDGRAHIVRGGEIYRNPSDPKDRMFTQIRRFLQSYPDGVSTEQILNRFGNEYSSSKKEKRLFIKTLRSLAECKNGIWAAHKIRRFRGPKP